MEQAGAVRRRQRRAVMARRTVLAGAAGAALGFAASACSPQAGPSVGRPGELLIGIGFEDVVAGKRRWSELAARIAECGATGVSVGVGRPEWVAFPWSEHADRVSSQAASGGDLVAGLLQALQQEADLEVALTLDALVPRMIARTPSLAGRDASGAPSDSFASLTALTAGAVRDSLVELTAEVCARYSPAAVALTELMFDDETFGSDDLKHFQEATGADDWPRTANGSIEIESPEIAEWRSRALASVLGDLREVTEPAGVRLDMDVRAPLKDPAADRALSGHDYDVLLSEADRIVLWNYPGLNSTDAQLIRQTSAHLSNTAQGRFAVSTGLWTEDADGGSPLSAGVMMEHLWSSTAGGAQSVAITPASLMSGEHWRALADWA